MHIRDMKGLPQSIAEKFRHEGQRGFSKTENKYSAIPFDKAHEQENKVVKSAGGAVGLTENPTAFRYVYRQTITATGCNTFYHLSF